MGNNRSYQELRIRQKGKVVEISIDRDESLNTLSMETLRELNRAFAGLRACQDIEAIILKGAGVKAFAAGAVIDELLGLDPVGALRFSRLGQGLFELMASLEQPIIAAIDGYCMGGGCDLALACDIRIATNRSQFAHPGARMGIITGFGGTRKLPRQIGKQRAKELFFSCDTIDAFEAWRIGLVDQVVKPKELKGVVYSLANKILGERRRRSGSALGVIDLFDIKGF